MKQKKILILSLGVGKISNGEAENANAQEAFEALVEKKEWKYREADYEINGRKKRANFLGDVLMEEYQPDIILVIGTIRSMWDAMYCNLYLKTQNMEDVRHEQAKKTFAELYKIVRENNGHEEKRENLLKWEKEIERCLNGSEIQREGKTYIKICPVLVEYGKDEVGENNYSHIKELLESCMETDAENEIAFDITHSFRSIPFYNMTTINYLKGLGRYRIKIRHIYYGNLDIREELNNQSPVEDIGILAKMMELTSAVETFRCTGNAGLLIQAFPKGNGFTECLKKYEWATKCNDYTEIVNVLQKIMREKEEKDDSITGDAKALVIRMLKEQFPTAVLLNAKMNIQDMAKMQYLLSKWYFMQNQYGIAVATALESLRSSLVFWYMEIKREKLKEVTVKDYLNEENRRSAVERLKYITRNNAGQESREMDLFDRLEKARKDAVSVRNCFAHNLMIDHEQAEDDSASVEKIKTLMEVLEEFHDYGQKSALKKIYNARQGKNTEKIQSKNQIRLFVGLRKKWYLEDFERQSNKYSFDCYQLPKEIRLRLEKDSKGKAGQMVYHGYFLAEYIKTHFDEEQDVTVVFDETLQKDQLVCYTEILYAKDVMKLQSLDCKNKKIIPIRRLNLPLDLETKNYELECEKDTALKEPPEVIR